MRTSRVLIAAAVLLAALIPASGFAQVESTPIPAPVKPNFSSLSFMAGSWTCTSKSSRRPRAFTTVSTYTLDPTGYWMNETSTTPKTSWVPTTLRTWDKITYDPDAKRGSTYLTATAAPTGFRIRKAGTATRSPGMTFPSRLARTSTVKPISPRRRSAQPKRRPRRRLPKQKQAAV
jgi:hypothetical protein